MCLWLPSQLYTVPKINLKLRRKNESVTVGADAKVFVPEICVKTPDTNRCMTGSVFRPQPRLFLGQCNWCSNHRGFSIINLTTITSPNQIKQIHCFTQLPAIQVGGGYIAKIIITRKVVHSRLKIKMWNEMF